MEVKTKINKLNLIKFLDSRGSINKMNKRSVDWEKIFANDATSKGLISKKHKQLIYLNIIKTNNPIKEGAEDPNRHFSREDIQIAKKHMKNAQHY